MSIAYINFHVGILEFVDATVKDSLKLYRLLYARHTGCKEFKIFRIDSGVTKVCMDANFVYKFIQFPIPVKLEDDGIADNTFPSVNFEANELHRRLTVPEKSRQLIHLEFSFEVFRNERADIEFSCITENHETVELSFIHTERKMVIIK